VPELIRLADIAFVAVRRTSPGTFVRQRKTDIATVYRLHQYQHKQDWTRLAGDVVGGSQSIHRHLISLGALFSLSSFGFHDGDDPHRTRRDIGC
jgi:hypothetical protein